MKSILLAGFGGQGVLFAGKLLASAGMYSGKNVTWLPSYGPEMRGGTANCCVNIDDGEIGSPIVPNPDILIAMNLPSYIKFESKISSNGCLICDSSLISEKSVRSNIGGYYIPATELAYNNELKGLANVIMIGHMLSASKIFTMEEIYTAMVKSIPASKGSLIELNRKALEIGYNYIAK